MVHVNGLLKGENDVGFATLDRLASVDDALSYMTYIMFTHLHTLI